MEWIKVSEKLPDESGRPNGIMVIVYCLPTNRPRMYGNVVTAVFYKGKFHWEFSKGYIMQPTHWMSLPDDPKK